jgi:hypothetical protein
MKFGVLFFLVTPLCCAALGFAQTHNKPTKPKPLVVLYERNPWLMVVGADSPTFALYESGLVIFLRESREYGSVVLDEKERSDFLDSLGLDKSFYDLKENYFATRFTDQPTSVLTVWAGGSAKKVTVYGNLRTDPEARSNAPGTFLRIFDALVSYDMARAIPWIPGEIEVMVWPFEHSRGEPLAWPNEWPDLKQPTTRKRGSLYSIHLDSRHFDELKKLLKSRGETQAMLIDGKKWAVSFRFPFPHE